MKLIPCKTLTACVVSVLPFVAPATLAAPAQQAYLKASNTGAFDAFGYSVAISGDMLVVGAPGEDSSATGVDGNQSDDSLSGAGATYVFVRNGTNWLQQAYLKPSYAGTRGDNFGCSVAVSGDTVLVGASYESSSATGVNGDPSASDGTLYSGAAYVFARNGTNWNQQAYLKASNASANFNFGSSVAISGDTVVVGAFGEKSSATGVDGDQSDTSSPYAGAAYVFVRDGTNWSQQAYLKASNTEADDLFGSSVAISADTVVIGAVREDSNATGVNGDQSNNSATNSGAAYVFVRDGTTWSQQAYLKASNPGGSSLNFIDGDTFGYSVAISGDTVVVGATTEDSNATGGNGNQSNNSSTDSGAAYIFVRNGTTWSQQAYLKASNTGAGDYFGRSVAISGDTAVVGAYSEDSNASGVNGNQSDNSSTDSGAAYVFARNGTNWAQQAYLKASNTDAGDGFGGAQFSVNALAISGNMVVVGAFAEDSNATGVNGNQSDNSATNSGAAYVFTGFGVGTRLSLTTDGSDGYFISFKGIPDFTYQLQRAAGLTGPWSSIATNAAPASGLIEFHDTAPLPGQAFYRAK